MLQLAGTSTTRCGSDANTIPCPQFEVVIGADFISESDALAILESSRTRGATSTAGLAQSDLSNKVRESAAAELPETKRGDGGHGGSDNDDDVPISETYELVNDAPFRYLCSVPVIAPPPVLNRTATELAKAEEARELSRATAKGWELMSGLDGTCMYFTSGWWSYSFCYGKAVVQYHALPGRPGEAPVRDENSLEYVLGRSHNLRTPRDRAGDPQHDDQTTSLTPPNSQLQTKGESRYLSQRLEDGTICDLTGRPRTVEIQYHCSPGATADRIGWIKEVTTCTYLMVVYTPRLCSDMAFQPPKETRAHPIRCRPIASTDEEESLWQYYKRLETNDLLNPKAKNPAHKGPAGAGAGGKVPQNHFVGTTIGGVVVGAKRLVGDDLADKLPLPRGVTRQPPGAAVAVGAGVPAGTAAEAVVEVLASKKKDAAKVEVMSDEELEKLNLDPKTVQEFREEMERIAGNKGWKLQVVDVPGGGLEYVGAFDDDEEEGNGAAGEQQGQQQQGQGQQRKQALPVGGKKAAKGKVGEKKGGWKEKGREEEEGDEEGSQEVFFREEL